MLLWGVPSSMPVDGPPGEWRSDVGGGPLAKRLKLVSFRMFWMTVAPTYDDEAWSVWVTARVSYSGLDVSQKTSGMAGWGTPIQDRKGKPFIPVGIADNAR